MLKHENIIKLEDGSSILLRTSTIADLDEIYDFFQSLPEENRLYLRVDVSDKKIVTKRCEEIDNGRATRLIAIYRDKIIGEAELETMRYGWLRKSGEVRMLVLPRYENLQIEKLLAREIFLLAARYDFYTLLARVLKRETDIYKIFKKLHFKHEATQKNHLTDVKGNLHDVYLLTFNLRKMWKDMEETVRETISSPFDH